VDSLWPQVEDWNGETLSVKLRSMDCSVHARKELKKVRYVATSPLPPPYTLKVACLNFGM